MKNLETTLNDLLVVKAPFQLPSGLKTFLVTIAPWASIVAIIALAPRILSVLGMGQYLGSYGGYNYGYSFGMMYYLATAVLALHIVLIAMAIPGLMKKSRGGWQFAYYAAIVGSVYGILSALSMPFAMGGLFSTLISSLITLYIVFQVKNNYN